MVKAAKKIFEGCFLTIFVPHTVEALLNSHYAEHFSVSHLTSYEVFLLTGPYITFLHYNNLNPNTLLPSVTKSVPNHCLTLIHHLLTPCDDLQEMPSGNADFWFTDGSYLKCDNGTYPGHACSTPFDVVEAAPLTMVTWPNRLNYTLLHGFVV